MSLPPNPPLFLQKAYNLLKESFMTQTDPCSDFNEKAVGRFYIMGSICLAEGRIREAYELLNKVINNHRVGVLSFCNA